MTQKAIPFPEKLSKYLQLGNHEMAHREARLLWDEATCLIKAAGWRASLSIDRFYAFFHPYAESSQAIRRLLRGAREVCLFAATLGDALERRSKEYLGQNEAFRGYILDRMGSFLAEEQIRRMDDLIVGECAEKGLGTTRRYSPGYLDFSLEAQTVFVKLASAAVPGLKLTEDCLLIPEKSITAIKGVLQKPFSVQH